MLTKPFAPDDERLADWGLTRDEWEALIAAQRDEYFGAVGGGAWRVTLDGATHESFTDEPYAIAALEGEDTSTAERELATVRAYVLAFLDMALRDTPTELLDAGTRDGVTIEAWP
jgi:hypothetical protein